MLYTNELKSTVSRSHRLELDDVLKTKEALHGLGYYEVPDYGMTPYSDEQMFDALKQLQHDNGLTVDGVMHPCRETDQTLSRRLANARAGANSTQTEEF